MNPNLTLLNLRGKEFPRSYPTQEEIDELPTKKNKQGIEVPDIDKLERETVGNVILNCLSYYKCKSNKEGFYVNLIAQSMITENDKVELKEKIKKFLIGVLENSIIRETKEEEKKEIREPSGIYAGWILCQCIEEILGKEKLNEYLGGENMIKE